jgi:putative membrane protein (TIGR04086 family)
LEHFVTKNTKKPKAPKEEKGLSQPSISRRTALIIIAIISAAIAGLAAWQMIPSKGWVEGILWGLLYGALVWAMFFGNILMKRYLRK